MPDVADDIIDRAAEAFRDLAGAATVIASKLDELRTLPIGGDDPMTVAKSRLTTAVQIINVGADHLQRQMAAAGQSLREI